MKTLKEYVKTFPDFPIDGILFRDICGILQEPKGLRMAVDALRETLFDIDFQVFVGPESRGFIFGTPLAYLMEKSFVLARKPGKLPGETVSKEYDLEYGSTKIEIQKNVIKPGQKVVIIDDLLATGGTTKAVAQLIEDMGGEVVKILFVIELPDLHGRAALADYDVESLITFSGH